jgi:formate hydrogenlyase transcriptional activator
VINSSGPKLHLVDELKKPHKDLTKANRTLADVEREYIMRVLEQTHWKVSGNNSAAEILGPRPQHLARPHAQTGY